MSIGQNNRDLPQGRFPGGVEPMPEREGLMSNLPERLKKPLGVGLLGLFIAGAYFMPGGGDGPSMNLRDLISNSHKAGGTIPPPLQNIESFDIGEDNYGRMTRSWNDSVSCFYTDESTFIVDALKIEVPCRYVPHIGDISKGMETYQDTSVGNAIVFIKVFNGDELLPPDNSLLKRNGRSIIEHYVELKEFEYKYDEETETCFAELQFEAEWINNNYPSGPKSIVYFVMTETEGQHEHNEEEMTAEILDESNQVVSRCRENDGSLRYYECLDELTDLHLSDHVFIRFVSENCLSINE